MFMYLCVCIVCVDIFFLCKSIHSLHPVSNSLSAVNLSTCSLHSHAQKVENVTDRQGAQSDKREDGTTGLAGGLAEGGLACVYDVSLRRYA